MLHGKTIGRIIFEYNDTKRDVPPVFEKLKGLTFNSVSERFKELGQAARFTKPTSTILDVDLARLPSRHSSVAV